MHGWCTVGRENEEEVVLPTLACVVVKADAAASAASPARQEDEGVFAAQVCTQA